MGNFGRKCSPPHKRQGKHLPPQLSLSTKRTLYKRVLRGEKKGRGILLSCKGTSAAGKDAVASYYYQQARKTMRREGKTGDAPKGEKGACRTSRSSGGLLSAEGRKEESSPLAGTKGRGTDYVKGREGGKKSPCEGGRKNIF